MDSYFWQEKYEEFEDEKLYVLLSHIERERLEEIGNEYGDGDAIRTYRGTPFW